MTHIGHIVLTHPHAPRSPRSHHAGTALMAIVLIAAVVAVVVVAVVSSATLTGSAPGPVPSPRPAGY
jgi:hypothetical protein